MVRVVTPRGRAMVGITLLLFALALVTGYPELFVLAACGLASLVLAAGWILRRPDLTIDRNVVDDRVPRGEPALGELLVRNAARWPSPPTLALEPCGAVAPPQPVLLDRLPSGAEATFRYDIPTARRAAFDLGPLRLHRADPLGLMRTTQVRGDRIPFWVHPRTHHLSSLPPGAQRTLEGPDRDHAPHGSTTFHALREYVIGDDLRHVHWRSSARLGQLMVRENIDVSLPDTTIVVDTRRSVHDAAGFEEAMEAAASVVKAIVAEGYPLRLVTTCGRQVRARTGGGHDLLDVLSEVDPSESELTDVVLELSVGRRGDALVLITGAATIDDMASVAMLSRRFRTTTVAAVGAPGGPPAAPPGSVVLSELTAAAFAEAWNVAAKR